MGSAGKGAVAGLVAGVVYGIFLAISSYYVLLSDKSTIVSAIGKSLPANSTVASEYTPDQLYDIALVAAPVVAAVLGVVGGLVVGAVYGWAVERIPGRTPVVKGVVVGLCLWLLLSVLIGLRDLFSYGVGYYLSGVGTGLVEALVFGVLLGYVYGRLIRPKETYELRDDAGALKGT
ncbi:MAG: hypothetical protein ABSF83_00995 [Nitrososphaerales archaeon]|jgi:hypothetical protein